MHCFNISQKINHVKTDRLTKHHWLISTLCCLLQFANTTFSFVFWNAPEVWTLFFLTAIMLRARVPFLEGSNTITSQLSSLSPSAVPPSIGYPRPCLSKAALISPRPAQYSLPQLPQSKLFRPPLTLNHSPGVHKTHPRCTNFWLPSFAKSVGLLMYWIP